MAPIYRRTRIAPTPSGYLHIGNVLSFALTAALAARYNARILLRIDDLDQERARPKYVQDIFETLDFMGIPWHEGPRDATEFEQLYAQRHRMHLYEHALDRLAEEQKVFACDCSRAAMLRLHPDGIYTGTCLHKAIPLATPGAAWRLLTGAATPFTAHTIDGTVPGGLPDTMKYFVVKRRDGLPAYQLASVVDDLHFGVDLIVRGQDLLPSTMAQLYLAQVAGLDAFSRSTFYHHPLLRNGAGEKLSKTAGDISIRYLRNEGKKPAAIYAFIGRQLGIAAEVSKWETLAAAVLDNPSC